MGTLKSITITDGGDGSTFLEIEFEDGTTTLVSGDIPYDGHLKIAFKDGKEIGRGISYSHAVPRLWPL